MIVNVQSSSVSKADIKAVTAKVTPVNFDKIAKETGAFKALNALGKAGGTLTQKIDITFQRAIDLARAKNGNGQIACTVLGKELRESEFMNALEMSGIYGKGTRSNYAQGAMRALHFNVQWTPTLFQDSEKMLPWSKKAKPETIKSGGVKSTDRESLIATLSKAMQQARILKMNEFVADLTDLCVDRIADFKEIEAK